MVITEEQHVGGPEAAVEFSVNMTCGNCADKIKKALLGSGVKSFEVDVDQQLVRISSDKHSSELRSILESTGKTAILTGLGGGTSSSSLGAAVAMLGFRGTIIAPGGGPRGVIRFNQIDRNRCVIEGTVDGLEPGEHGLAVHETGDVSQGCTLLGDHYNPRQTRHGSPENGEAERHVGDLGNIVAGPDGRATFRIVDSLIKVWDVIGRSIVVAEGRDDLGIGQEPGSLVNGNCGKGVTCGIIARAAAIGQNYKRICACDGTTLWDGQNPPDASANR